MRTTFTTALSTLLLLTPTIVSAHDSGHLVHKRVVNSRRAAAAAVNNSKRDDAAAALAGIGNILAQKDDDSITTTNGGGAGGNGPVKAVAGAPPVSGAASEASTTPSTAAPSTAPATTGCFPSADFKMPDSVPSSTEGWWCDPSTEYAFMGFSYEVTSCQSKEKLQKEFKDIKETFGGRYIRLYGACDRKGFYDDIVDAAWDNGLGVHSLVWFGFEGGNIWKTRRDSLFSSLKNNPKAPYVTRVVQFGSEPLFDSVLPPAQLADQVNSAKETLKPLGIPVTVSEMAYGFQKYGGAKDVLDAVDWVNAHMLPFFSTKATTGSAAWPIVQTDIEWFMKHAPGKKLYLDENAWPSTTYSGVKANSAKAVANTDNEHQYYELLDSKCDYFKNTNGGIGWFFHLYSDEQEPGYGLYDHGGKTKFDFKPKTSC